MQSLPGELIDMIYNLLYRPKDAIRFSLTSAHIYAMMPYETQRRINILKLYRDVHFDITNMKYLSGICRQGQYSISLLGSSPVMRIMATGNTVTYYYKESTLYFNLYFGHDLCNVHAYESTYDCIQTALLHYFDDNEITCKLTTIIKNITDANLGGHISLSFDMLLRAL